ncbi:hypothetical protein [Streptomyces sp. NPDC005407]|jgi:hypothetical protein|uniref:hypothetical protein n=1 Tax=Streptomyces sp. NPDC005407 TaxID=3155340 RepID=UPI0033BDC2EB
MRRRYPVNPTPPSQSPPLPSPPTRPRSYVGPILLVAITTAGMCTVLFTLLVVLKAVTAAAAAVAGAAPTAGGVALSLALRKRD